MANDSLIAGPTLIGDDLQWAVHSCPSTLRREFRDVFVGTFVPIPFLSFTLMCIPHFVSSFHFVVGRLSLPTATSSQVPFLSLCMTRMDADLQEKSLEDMSRLLVVEVFQLTVHAMTGFYDEQEEERERKAQRVLEPCHFLLLLFNFVL